MSELDLSKNNLRSEGLSAVSEALKSTAIKQLNIANNNLTYNQQNKKDMAGVIKFAEDMKDMGALSSLTFNGGKPEWSDGSGWVEGEVVTIDTHMVEANFSNKELGSTGAQILASFIGRKFFQDNGALSKLDIQNNVIDEERKAEIQQTCDSKSITCLL